MELCAHLQRPGCKVNTRTGNAFWLESYKDICSQAIIHVIPERQDISKVAWNCKVVWGFGGFYFVFTSTRTIYFCIQLLDFTPVNLKKS